MRIYDNFESRVLLDTVAAFGIASEADYEHFTLKTAEPLPSHEVANVFHALGSWALVHDRVEEARQAWATGLTRCYEAGGSPYESYCLEQSLANLLDSSFAEGNGDALRQEHLARLEAHVGSNDPAFLIFLEFEAATCAWHGRLSLAGDLLHRVVDLTQVCKARQRRKVARRLRDYAACCSRTDGKRLLEEAAMQLDHKRPPPLDSLRSRL